MSEVGLNTERGEALYVHEATGQRYFLKYDFDALCRFEDMRGKSVAELFDGESGESNLGFADLRALFIVGLRKMHKRHANESSVGNLLTLKTMPQVAEAVMNGLGEAFGKEEDLHDPEAPQSAGESGPTSAA